MTNVKAWLLLGCFILVVVLVVAGVHDERIDLTAVALALVTFMGLLTKSLTGTEDSKDDQT